MNVDPPPSLPRSLNTPPRCDTAAASFSPLAPPRSSLVCTDRTDRTDRTKQPQNPNHPPPSSFLHTPPTENSQDFPLFLFPLPPQCALRGAATATDRKPNEKQTHTELSRSHKHKPQHCCALLFLLFNQTGQSFSFLLLLQDCHRCVRPPWQHNIDDNSNPFSFDDEWMNAVVNVCCGPRWRRRRRRWR